MPAPRKVGRPQSNEQWSLRDMASFLEAALHKQALEPNLLAYKPHAKQELFHKSTAYGRWFLGGNRSGKSVAGVIEDLWWATKRHPYRKIDSHLQIRGRVVGVDFPTGCEQILFPIFKRWVVPSDLVNGSWEDSFNKLERTMFFADGSYIEFKSSDQDLEKHAGTSRHFCVDDQTYVMSEQGWSNIDSLVPQENILTRGKTGHYEWKPVNFIYRAESEFMYRLRSRNNFDVLVTGDHRWLVYNKKSKKEYYTTTRELKTSEQLIVSADSIDLPDKQPTYSDEFVALVGWLITDGCVSGYNFNISQALDYNSAKCDTIQRLLKAVDAQYYINDVPYAQGTYRHFQIRGTLRDQLRAVAGPDKELPYWFINSLTEHQLEILLDAIILGDGQYLESGKWTVTATRSQHIDAITYLAVLCGYRVNNYPTKHNWSVINAKSHTGNRYDYRKISVDSLDITVEKYNGRVWCPNTENSNFVAYRGGRVFLTGNCHFDEEPPKMIFEENLLRLVDVGGNWWLTMSPINGMTWVYDDLYERVPREDFEPVHPLPADYLEIFQIEMDENPHITAEEKERALAFLDADNREKREKGLFIPRGGRVFKEYFETIHNRKPADWRPPKDWLIYTSTDSGFRVPAAHLYHAVHPSGFPIVTFYEFYGKERLVKDWAADMLAFEKEEGLQIWHRTGDPAMQQRNGTGITVLQEYWENGIEIGVNNVPKDPAVGINRMTQYFTVDPRTGEPYWTITQACPNFNKELKRLEWETYQSAKLADRNDPKERVHKKNDHAFDSAKYFATCMPDLGALVEKQQPNTVDSPFVQTLLEMAQTPLDTNKTHWETRSGIAMEKLIGGSYVGSYESLGEDDY